MVNNHFASDHLTFVDLSLSRIRSFLEKIGNPQNQIKNIIHVAGTNGKGSTCAFLRSILEGHGYSVNVFTSPHLINYNERFRLSGKLISNEYLKEIEKDLQNVEGFKELSVFELTMVIGFVAFYKTPADFNIVEVGLGGRLDASNVIKNPLLSIITTIDFDHQNFLGNTLDKIAYEKAGIIKQNSTLITDYQTPEVFKVIKKQSLRMNANLISAGKNYEVSLENNTPILSYNNHKISLNKIALQGKHQYYNASMAIVGCINILKDKFDYTKVEDMLGRAEWQGRLQQVKRLYGVDFKNSDVYLDGAHNVSGCRVLCNFIKDKYSKSLKNGALQADNTPLETLKNADTHIHIFIGMLAKKDLDGFFAIFSKLKSEFNITIYPIEIEGHSSYLPKDIAKVAENYGFSSVLFNEAGKTIGNILETIDNNQQKNVIIICGSLYLLGKILGENQL